MTDVFLNLAIQSLSSSVEIQPLILPLFAPAPSLVSDATLSPSVNQPTVAAEAPPPSFQPEIIAGEMIDTLEIEPSLRETTSPETRPVLPNLIPSHTPEYPTSTLSIRHLLRSQPYARQKVEPTIPVSLPSVSALTSSEPKLEERTSFSLQADNPAETEVSPQVPVQQPMPAPTRDTTPDSISDTSAISPSTPTTRSESQPDRNSFPSSPAKYKLQSLSPEGPAKHKIQMTPSEPSSKPTVEREERVSTPSRPSPVEQPQSIIYPVIQPLLSPSSPPPQLSSQSEQSVNAGEVQAQQPLSWQSTPQATTVNPSNQQAVIPPPARTSDSTVKPHLEQPVRYDRGNERGEVVMSRLFLDTTEPSVQPIIPSQPARPSVQPIIPSQSAEPSLQPIVTSDALDIIQTPPLPLAMPAQNVMPVVTRHVSRETQTTVAGTEFETPPVRVTIGRVVVRATPIAPPAPTQKRVLRPALSLSEYLKQRERGSR